MAKCPNPECKSTNFKLERIEPQGAMYAEWLLVCNLCHTAIGPAGFNNDLDAIKQAIKVIAQRIGVQVKL